MRKYPSLNRSIIANNNSQSNKSNWKSKCCLILIHICIPFKVWSSTGSVNLRYTWESNGHAKDKSRHFVTKVYSKLQAFKFGLFRSFYMDIQTLDQKDWRPKQYILTSWGKLQGSQAVWESVWCLFIAAGPNVHQSPTKSCILLVLSLCQSILYLKLWSPQIMFYVIRVCLSQH